MAVGVCMLAFVLLFTLATVNAAGRGNLEADCEYDDDCYMDNTFCHMQMRCQCKKNYEPNQSRDACIARIGAPCRSRFDCSSLENSECKQNLCDCQDGFMSYQDRSCLRLPARMDDSCETNDQCKVLGDNTICINRKCQCEPYHHKANGKCFNNVGLGQPCNQYECYIDENHVGVVECRNRICSCRSGYRQTSHRSCESGATRSLPISRFVFVIPIVVIISWISSSPK